MESIPQNKNIGKNLIADSFFDELNEHKFFGLIISKAVNIQAEKLKNKIIDIIKIINSQKINLYNLKKLLSDGLPDDIPSLRSLIWKMMMGYLPLNVDKWEDHIDNKRIEYTKSKTSIFTKLELEKIKRSNDKQDKKLKVDIEILDNGVNKINISNKNDKNNNVPIKQIRKKTSDHPLNIQQDSKWKSYFDDLDLLEEIDKDVRRTRTHMHFFFMPSKSNVQIISNEQVTEIADKKRNDPGNNNDKILQKSFESNADVMCRILFMYAKKYPEVRYVQGMNEILAPILYCFSSDQNPYFYLNLEADSFICFEYFMNQIKDVFNRTKDNTDTGIQTHMKNLTMILKLVDKEIFDQFNDEKVEIQYFGFRWYTLFLTQEFEMPDILRLWDSVLAEDDKFEFLNMMCLSIIKSKKTEIMQSDFSQIMICMQTMEKLEMEKLIKTANSIRLELNKNIH